jgi:hypothetical protein
MMCLLTYKKSSNTTLTYATLFSAVLLIFIEFSLLGTIFYMFVLHC